MTSTPGHVLVTGASGYVGSRLVATLARSTSSDIAITATARSLDSLNRFDFPPSVVLTELDVSDPASCRAAFAQAAAGPAGPVTAVYFLVHSIGEGDFAEQDLDSARVLARAAHEAGATRIIYLGGLVPTDEKLSEHLESRADVGDALGDAGVELVWLRAAVILGAGSTSYELIRHIADRVPVIPIPMWMNHVVSPIAVDDVLRYLVAAADATVPAGCFDISGDDRPTYAELIKAYATARGLRRILLPFPPIWPALVARIVSWLTPLPRELTVDLILSLPNSTDSTDHAIRSLVPNPHGGLTSMIEALDRSGIPDPLCGVCATTDPLSLTDTDPEWAR